MPRHIASRRSLLLTSMIAAMVMAAPSFAAEKFASKDEFVAAAAGKTLTTQTKKGKTFTVSYDAAGGGTFSVGDMKPGKFSWTFKDETLCSDFKAMKFKECNKVVVSGPNELKFFDAKSGALNNVYSVK